MPAVEHADQRPDRWTPDSLWMTGRLAGSTAAHPRPRCPERGPCEWYPARQAEAASLVVEVEDEVEEEPEELSELPVSLLVEAAPVSPEELVEEPLAALLLLLLA
jgi:hypothetical protein